MGREEDPDELEFEEADEDDAEFSSEDDAPVEPEGDIAEVFLKPYSTGDRRRKRQGGDRRRMDCRFISHVLYSCVCVCVMM